jgi:hypothetical protein
VVAAIELDKLPGADKRLAADLVKVYGGSKPKIKKKARKKAKVPDPYAWMAESSNPRWREAAAYVQKG